MWNKFHRNLTENLKPITRAEKLPLEALLTTKRTTSSFHQQLFYLNLCSEHFHIIRIKFSMPNALGTKMIQPLKNFLQNPEIDDWETRRLTNKVQTSYTHEYVIPSPACLGDFCQIKLDVRKTTTGSRACSKIETRPIQVLAVALMDSNYSWPHLQATITDLAEWISLIYLPGFIALEKPWITVQSLINAQICWGIVFSNQIRFTCCTMN